MAAGPVPPRAGSPVTERFVALSATELVAERSGLSADFAFDIRWQASGWGDRDDGILLAARYIPLPALRDGAMDIRFISTLTPEDENRLARALLAAVASMLDQFTIVYTVRIQTTGGKTLQHTHSPDDDRSRKAVRTEQADRVGASAG